MPKRARPWWHPVRQRWMIEINGWRVTLGPHPEGATPPRKGKTGWNPPDVILEAAAKAEVAAKQEAKTSLPARSGNLVCVILDAFLEHHQRHSKKGTYESYLERIQSFRDYLKSINLWETLTVDDLRPFHVRDWVESNPKWSPGGHHGRIMTIQTAFNWAEEEGRIVRSPIARMKKPPQGKREVIITPEEYNLILANVPRQPFRDLLTVAWESGSRPEELVIVEARHLQEDAWVFAPEEAKGGRWRMVFLSPTALEIVRRLNAANPEGPIFRNTEGEPWTGFSTNCAFLRLQTKLGKKWCLYNFRHTWATAALKVLDPVTVSVLMGHTDTSMLAKVYQHLSQDQAHLREAARKVWPKDA